ncbi:Undecaprenyl-diphosphatase OS=Streptomyces albaduncus OX=68172 GN=FHS32_006869 PE=4 SV=1 [Streptomyces griseoloalbus]
MAVLAESGSNPSSPADDINGLAKDAPHWFDRVMEYVGEYGILFGMVLLILWCWWGVRRRGGEDAASSVAALVWAPLLAAALAVRERPHKGVRRAAPAVPHS